MWRRTVKCLPGVLELLADAGLVKGKRIGIDATTLEAECGAAIDRAARQRRELRGVSERIGAAAGDRNADARRSGADGSEAEKEGIERGVGESPRSGRAHHQAEGREHTSGAQGRARRGYGYWRSGGGDLVGSGFG